MTEQVPQPEASPEARPTLGHEFGPETGDEVEPGNEAPTESELPARDVDVPDAAESATRTGVPAVDEVLAEVDRLHDRPLEEHLATFERAHERLRAALDADPGDAGDPAGSDDPA